MLWEFVAGGSCCEPDFLRVLYGFWWSSSVLCLVLVVNQWPASHWSVTEFAVLVVVESGNKAFESDECPQRVLRAYSVVASTIIAHSVTEIQASLRAKYRA